MDSDAFGGKSAPHESGSAQDRSCGARSPPKVGSAPASTLCCGARGAAYVEALQDLVRPAGAADNQRWEKAELALRKRAASTRATGPGLSRVGFPGCISGRIRTKACPWFPVLRRRFGPDVALCTRRDSCKMHDYREHPPTRYAVVYREAGGQST